MLYIKLYEKIQLNIYNYHDDNDLLMKSCLYFEKSTRFCFCSLRILTYIAAEISAKFNLSADSRSLISFDA